MVIDDVVKLLLERRAGAGGRAVISGRRIVRVGQREAAGKSDGTKHH